MRGPASSRIPAPPRTSLRRSSSRRPDDRCSSTRRDKLFAPLGIPSQPAEQPLLEEPSMGGYDTSGFSWPVDHQGVNFGGGWLRLTAGDILKLGQLLLDEGRTRADRSCPRSGCATRRRNRSPPPKLRRTGTGTSGGSRLPRANLRTPRSVTAASGRGRAVEAAGGGLRHRGADHDSLPRVDGKAYEDIVSYQVLPRLGH